VDTEKASKNWGEVVGMAELVLNSKLSRLDNLKDLDVGAFLRGTGAEFMQKMDTVAALQEDNEYEKEFKGAMKGMKVKLISSEGDKAVVEVTPMGKRPKKETFVRVEGKWLPEEMQKDWKGMMEDGRKQIEEMARELTGENKQKFMETMSKAEEVLGKLAAAKDAKAFNMAFGAMMRDVMGDMMPGMMGGGMPGGDMR
jgi:NurA-like 5'-3' nuclease